MDIKDAQANMRSGYIDGAPGLFISAAMWLAAGAVAAGSTAKSAVIVLLVGGMLIHPLAVLVCKFAGRPGAHAKENPLGALALESTAILLLGVMLALALAQFRVELFFPAMLLVIGGRYMVFQTLYGQRVYWLCGGMLAALGIVAAMLKLPVAAVALAGGFIEVVFGAIVLSRQRRGGTVESRG
jgi:hypothetical protein